MQPYQEIVNMDAAGYPSPQGYGAYGYYIGSGEPGAQGSSPGGGIQTYDGSGYGFVANPLAGNVIMPSPTSVTMPSVADTVKSVTIFDWFNSPVAPQPPPVLTPRSLTKDLPSIVQSAPVDVSMPVCDPVTQWVGDNPMMAVLLLAGAAMLVWKS